MIEQSGDAPKGMKLIFRYNNQYFSPDWLDGSFIFQHWLLKWVAGLHLRRDLFCLSLFSAKEAHEAVPRQW